MPVANAPSALRRMLRQRWQNWLRRRLPARRRVTLDQKRIFILPTWMGLGYLLTALLLFLAGVNYENSMILNFSFFLGSLFVVSILQTYGNLSGLVISAGHAEPAFAGQEAKFVVHLAKSRRKQHCSIYCSWHGFKSEACNLTAVEEVPVSLLIATSQRGRFRPGRFRLQTVYPFGLCHAWTWIDLDMEALVYPKPVECPLASSQQEADQEGTLVSAEGQEDFDGLRGYQPSDSLRTVDWKAYARSNTLYTKQFHGYQSTTRWLRWADVPGADLELRLSHLCYWVLELSREGEPYGLDLPGRTISPALGKSHEEACLVALAEFGHG